MIRPATAVAVLLLTSCQQSAPPTTPSPEPTTPVVTAAPTAPVAPPATEPTAPGAEAPAPPPAQSSAPVAATAAPEPTAGPAPAASAGTAEKDAASPTKSPKGKASGAVTATQPKSGPATLPVPVEPAPAGDPIAEPCETKNFHFPALSNACHSGGRKAARGVMSGVVKKAKAAGTDLKCSSCHEDMKSYHLKSNAVGDLKNWL